jgi:hypothetical protein
MGLLVNFFHAVKTLLPVVARHHRAAHQDVVVIVIFFYNEYQIVIHADFRVQPENLRKIKTEKFWLQKAPALLGRPSLGRVKKKQSPGKNQKKQRRYRNGSLAFFNYKFRGKREQQGKNLKKNNTREGYYHHKGQPVNRQIRNAGNADHRCQNQGVDNNGRPQKQP